MPPGANSMRIAIRGPLVQTTHAHRCTMKLACLRGHSGRMPARPARQVILEQRRRCEHENAVAFKEAPDGLPMWGCVRDDPEASYR
jgi:hypothetical protein